MRAGCCGPRAAGHGASVPPAFLHLFFLHVLMPLPRVPRYPSPSSRPRPHGHPQSFLFFYFCSKLWRWLLGVGGSEPSWAGAGGGIIALSALSPGGLCRGCQDWGQHRDTRPHKHTGHSTGVGVKGWEAGRRIALWEWGQEGTPSNWSLGRRLEAIMFPPLSEGEVRPPPPIWGWGRRLG